MAKLKRLTAPRFWKVPKKERVWTVCPTPGPHKKFECIPLQIILRDVLKVVDLGSEARTIVKRGEILVDGKIRKDHAYPAGTFDVVSIPKLKKNYRVVPSTSGLILVEISDKDAKLKLCKITNKSKFKKGKLQLNLHDGKNILVEKDDFKTGDTIMVDLPGLKIVKHLKFDKGMLGMITHGKNEGEIGTIKEIIPGKFGNPAKVICDISGRDAEILKEDFFVIGDKEPSLKLSE